MLDGITYWLGRGQPADDDRDVSAAAEAEAGDGGGRKLLVLRGSLVSFDGAHHYCGIALQERDSWASRVTEGDRVSRTR